ncbi:MAG TPA: class I SAM-dependent methyltransferase [Polyangia bacterium]
MSAVVHPDLAAYAAAHTTPPGPLLDELERETRVAMNGADMLTGHVEARLLQLLVRLCGARRVVEVGTFTGYASLMMAAGLPDGGELVTCEIEPAHAAVAERFFARSPVGRRIRLARGPALATLRALPAGSVDLVFIDADKEGYPAYYEESLRLLRPGGLIAVDNALWSGRVLAPEDDEDRAIAAVNDRAARDERVEAVLLTVRDGVLLVRKK